MRRPYSTPSLLKVSAATLLALGSLAMLAPALNVSANHEATSQQPLPLQDKPDSQAPLQPIRPVAVVTINFEDLARAEKRRSPSALKSEAESLEIHAPMTIPEPDVPLSSSESTKPPLDVPQPVEGGGALIGSPAPAASFVAQLDEPKVGTSTRTIPPDTTGAVGATRIFSTLNTNYRIQNKADGATLSTVSIDAFWAPLNSATPGPSPTPSPVAGVFDPRIQYDPYTGGGRWIVVAVSNSRTASASVLVGISTSPDPLGAFTLYRFVVGCAAGAAGCDASGEWADFPMLGFNKNWIAVGWNQFRTAGNQAFVAGKMLMVDYPALVGGTSTSMIFTAGLNQGFCMHPATTLSPTEETLYVPAHFSSALATYRLHRITGTAGAPVFNFDSVDKTRPGGGWIQPAGDILPQTCVGTIGIACPSSLRFIDSGDAYLRSNVVFRTGNIWYAQTIGLPAPAGGVLTHTAAQWTRLDTSGAFVDGGRINDPNATSTSGEWYAYPSISVNANGDALMGFSNFGWTHFARAAYAMRLNGDPAGTMRDAAAIKEGEDYYSKSFTGTRNRWGDYSHTMVDPDNDVDFWTIQEYASTRSPVDNLTTTNNSRWGTWWAKITPSGPPAGPLPTPAPCATALVVNDTGDAGDATIGDGVCATTGGVCTLRAALDEANARVYCGPVSITFSVTGQISLVNGQLFIAHDISVTGPGASQLTVRRSTAAGTPSFRIFQVLSPAVASISGLTISGGSINGSGGGIASAGTLTLTNVIVTGNSASDTARGGGLYVFGGSVAMNFSSIHGNSAVTDGGGIYIASGTVTLAHSAVGGNNASGIGGGIVNSGGVLLLVSSTIHGNSAGSSTGGGGIYTTGVSGVSVTIINSTISGNTAAGPGGGIVTFGPVTLTNSTVAGNAATNGGGIRIFNPTLVTLKNTIVAANTTSGGGPDLSGAFVSQDYNLIGNTSGATFSGPTTHNITNVNPLLGPLGINGGPTLTHALLPCSPALNAGNNALALDQNSSPLLTDQRGGSFNRISNGTVDIGAFELQAAAPDLLVTGTDLAAVDSVTLVRGPFALTANNNFSAEKRTRILFFATDLGFPQAAQPDINTLSVQIGGNSYPVEAVGPNSTTCGSYVVFRLPDLAPNTYQLGIRVRGVNSTNTPNLTIVASPSGPAAAAHSKKTRLVNFLLKPIIDLLL